MKKIYFCLLIISVLAASPVLAAKKATTAKPAVWKALTPEGYTAITWAQAPGIASFFKAPKDNGATDYLTRIYLPQNQIDFIIAPAVPADPNTATPAQPAPPPVENINSVTPDIATFPNLLFTRLVAEGAKSITPAIKFLWDAPFFNMQTGSSELSMAVKYSTGGTTTIASGSRSASDMAKPRRMLVINNNTGKATIKDFDSNFFVDNKNGDQALEGFSPAVVKSDGPGGGASRLFLGVSDDGKELVVYCSQLATVDEASSELTLAGVSIDHQLEADGGGSAACGYNLPGQFFVEPIRTLPLLMGAETILLRGTVTLESINVRGDPSTKKPIIAKLPKGTTVRVYEEKNGWYRIGDKQWILKSLIKKI